MATSDGVPAFAVEDILDEYGGIIKNITGVDLSEDTVTAETLLKGATAHDNTGALVVGVYEDGGGGICPCVCFNIIFEEDPAFELSFDDDSCFCVDFGEFTEGSSYDIYTGAYTVVPKYFDQILDTDEKLMSDDVTVLAVPYSEVSNPDGGLTVIIG